MDTNLITLPCLLTHAGNVEDNTGFIYLVHIPKYTSFYSGNGTVLGHAFYVLRCANFLHSYLVSTSNPLTVESIGNSHWM